MNNKDQNFPVPKPPFSAPSQCRIECEPELAVILKQLPSSKF